MIRHPDTEAIKSILREEYAKIPDNNAVDTFLLAEVGYKRLDPKDSAPALIKHVALLELRQLSRELCRGEFLEEQHFVEQGSLFDFKLQARYPCARNEKDDRHLYLPVAQMSEADFRFNVGKLRSEAHAKELHADVLEAEMEARQRLGLLATITD